MTTRPVDRDRSARSLFPLQMALISDAAMRRRDRDNSRAALEQTNWKIYGPGGAAELLGLRPTTLASRVTRMGLSRQE